MIVAFGGGNLGAVHRMRSVGVRECTAAACTPPQMTTETFLELLLHEVQGTAYTDV